VSELSADVVIIGSGLSGLVLGYRLQRLGLRVCVLEPSPQGPIFSVNQGGFLVERGLGDLLATPQVMNLLTELGLADQLVSATVKPVRYLWRQNRLQPVPDQISALLTTPLLTPLAKLRCLSEVFVKPGQTEETVTEFVTRRFGEEVAQIICAPIIQAVYGGDPGQLSAEAILKTCVAQERKHSSVLRAWLVGTKTVFTPTVSLSQGLQQLITTLILQLKQSFTPNQTVLRLQKLDRGYELLTTTGESLRTEVLVLATPAYSSGNLLKPLHAALARKLLSIYYPPLVTVALGYPQATLNHPLEGWGHLIPKGQGLNTLGGIWSSSLFPGRAPAGWHLITCLLGGAADPQAQELEEEDLVRAAHCDLQKIFKMRQEPRLIDCHRRPASLPQYCLGHPQKVAQIESGLQQMPGLFLCGNYLAGISPSEVIAQATGVAPRIHQYWLSQQRVPAF